MKKLNFVICLLLSIEGSNLLAQSTLTPDNNILEYLRDFREKTISAMTDSNPEILESFYADSLRMMPELQKTLLGKANAAAYNRAFLERFEVKNYKRSVIEISDLGEQILEIGEISMTLSLKSSGQEFEIKGNYFDLWKKLPNGDLSLITQCWNYHEYYAELHPHLAFDQPPGVHIALLPNVNITDNISFELTAYNRLLDATVTEHDANAWARYYADDAMLIPNYHRPLQGKEEISQYIETHVKELPVFQELDIRTDRIDNLGAFIVEYASHIASWKNGNSSGVGLGKNIRIWRREPDHTLKLFRSIAMYDY